MTSTCPHCHGSIELEQQIMQGEIVSCSECGADLEIMTLSPVQLAAAPEVEEDWGE